MLSLNVTKMNFMLVPSKQKNKILKVQNDILKSKIQGVELEFMQNTKYLGVQVDNTLDWREHIKTIFSKVSRTIAFLKHAKSVLPEYTQRPLYTSIVEPHFRYCSSVWDCYVASKINLLQKMQNRPACIATCSKFDTPM